MPAMPAPATLETNRRRDIVMNPPGAFSADYRLFVLFVDRAIYRTEAINDQVITTPSTRLPAISVIPDGGWPAKSL
jgi:hypothetical protein